MRPADQPGAGLRPVGLQRRGRHDAAVGAGHDGRDLATQSVDDHAGQPDAVDPARRGGGAPAGQRRLAARVSFVNAQNEVQAFDVPITSVARTATVGGTVPATLSLTLGPAAAFGAFTPGITQDVLRVDDRDRDLDRG